MDFCSSRCYKPNEESLRVRELSFNPNDKRLLARIRQMPIFDAMAPELLPPLLKLAKIRRYEPEEEIISEGDTDQQVYFLVSGSCTVNVDGLDVAAIASLGEVFGEMAALDSGPRSATITAETQTICMVLNGAFLDHLEGVDKLAAKALFYRIFCGILAARIRDTNTKILTMEEELKNLSVHRPTF